MLSKFIRLPKDDLALAIVDQNPIAPVNGVSEKDDFFIHTPRKTIADVLASRQVNERQKSYPTEVSFTNLNIMTAG